MSSAAPTFASAVIVLGGGGHGKVVAEVASAAGRRVLGFLDPGLPAGARVLGLPVLGAGDDLGPWLDGSHAFFPAIGDNAIRFREMERLRGAGVEVPVLAHPGAVVSGSAVLEAGVAVMPFATVHPDARLGAAVVVNTGAIVEHDCRIGAGAMIAPGAVLCGGVRVGALAFVGAGAVVTPGVSIGRGAFIGAGAVVVEDVPDGGRLVPVRRSRSA